MSPKSSLSTVFTDLMVPLSREDYWCRELCTVYPYGLNDNVKKVGNISKIRNNLIIWNLFNKIPKKYRKRSPTVSKRHNKRIDIGKDIETLLQNYRTPVFLVN